MFRHVNRGQLGGDLSTEGVPDLLADGDAVVDLQLQKRKVIRGVQDWLRLKTTKIGMVEVMSVSVY